MPTRQDIIAEARTWLGTRWLHQAGLKGVGVDCVHLAYEVGKALAIFPEPVPPLPPYQRRSNDNQMIALCDQFLIRTKVRQPGSIVALRLRDQTRHMGILGNHPFGGLSLIHAYAPQRKVIEHGIDDYWDVAIFAVFDFPGIE